jgi:glycerophosphoryl diester phosphodiesterase
MLKFRMLFLLLFLTSTLRILSQDFVNHFSSEYFEQQQFAHRGGCASGPENTLQTILYNIKNGVTCIEIDIQLTKDLHLVLFHDQSIERILRTNSKVDINKLTLQELKNIPLRDTTNGVQYVCSLDELIDTLAILIPATSINDFILELDFKPHDNMTDVAVDQLIQIINKHLQTFGDCFYNYFFISTFYPEVLKSINKKNQKIITAFSVNSTSDESKLKAKLAILFANYFIKKYQVEIIEPDICMITETFVKKWHKRNVLINTYTANSKCEKVYIENFEIAYTTNCPSGFCDPDKSYQIGRSKKWCIKCLKNK